MTNIFYFDGAIKKLNFNFIFIAMFGKGLVIGKFYPPHKGHQHLI